MQSTGKIIALVVVASVALAALSSVVNSVHMAPVFGQSGSGSDGSGAASPTIDLYQGSLTNVENDLRTMTDEQLNTTLMVLYGYTNTAYMRSAVMTDYDEGTWTSAPSPLQFYADDAILAPFNGDPQVLSMVSVSPVQGASGNIPVFKDLEEVRCPTAFRYCPEYGTVSIMNRITDSYECYFDVFDHNQSVLENASVPSDSRYLQIPSKIASEILKTAEFVTNGTTSPYDKAMELRDYLRSGYIYDLKYDPAPVGEDPVLWFLLHSKKGACTQFNSALTLMARSLGIPARYVVGFVVDQRAVWQSVRLAHAHAYCEIELDGVGWVIVDGAPFSFTDAYHFDATRYWKDDVVTSAAPKNESLAKIAGWVSTPLGEYATVPVVGLELGLYKGSDLSRVGRTDELGNFVFNDLPWGDYVLRPFLTDRWIPLDYTDLDLHCEAYSFHVVHFSVAPNPFQPQGEETFTSLDRSSFSLEQRTAFYANGTVVNADGIAQEGMGVEVLIADASTPSDRTICGIGNVTDGRFVICCMVPDDIPTGHYIVSAMAIGNSTHAPSGCSADADLFDDTTLVLISPRRVPQGVQVAMRATLLEKRSGQPVSGAEIWLEGENMVQTTDENGNVTFNVTHTQVGSCGAQARFNGSYYLGRSNASVSFTVVAIQAEMLTDTLVRGENNTVVGRVYATDMSAAGINVTVAPLVKGGNSSYNVTNYFGFFFLAMDVPKEGTSRGPTELRVSLEDYGVTNLTVRLKDRPKLVATASGSSADVDLAGPSSEPIPGAQLEVTAGNTTLLAMTDPKGGVEVGIPSGTETVKVSFQGNADYADAYAVAQVMPPGFDWTPVIVVAAGLCAAAGGAGIVYTRLQNRRPEVAAEPEVVEEITGPYRIEFPQVERGFPIKWGVDEQLQVDVSGQLENLRLLVDGSGVPLAVSDPTTARASILLPAGEHELIATGPKGSSMKLVRIVDYREETARLYGEAFDALASTSRRLTKDHTPREVEAIVAETMPGVCLESLEIAISRFEIAGFSDHRFGRPDYAEMEVAVQGIKAQCERRRAA
ncbi:MAG TPA: transglutaminase-like domain-containing protein [Methanomassiliicoccales archaeon]|nr:transglutaminase-like domain-containing protein [Methanomassiliicoccales archaeon]